MGECTVNSKKTKMYHQLNEQACRLIAKNVKQSKPGESKQSKALSREAKPSKVKQSQAKPDKAK